MLGVVASSVLVLPTVTINATTNFNQNRATLNATVNGFNLATTVTVAYKTAVGGSFSSEQSFNQFGVTGLESLYSNITGLTENTSYIVRVTATNAKTTVVTQTSGGDFKTWGLISFIKTTSGSYSVTVPTITPTGGTAITPSIYEVILYGAGGGANYSGGGGGAYRLASAVASSTAAATTASGSVGAGGTGGNGGSGAGGATDGEATTLTFSTSSYTANGGGKADWLTRGGSSGAGDNPAQVGGIGNYGYTYVSSYVYVCTAYDKYGINCTAGYYDYNQPIYSTDYNRYAGGGGGGTNASGGNATYPDGGGNGGAGGGAYGLRGGNGGKGGGTASFGSNGSVAATGTTVGTGGEGWYGAGLAGGVAFKYYAAT